MVSQFARPTAMTSRSRSLLKKLRSERMTMPTTIFLSSASIGTWYSCSKSRKVIEFASLSFHDASMSPWTAARMIASWPFGRGDRVVGLEEVLDGRVHDVARPHRERGQLLQAVDLGVLVGRVVRVEVLALAGREAVVPRDGPGEVGGHGWTVAPARAPGGPGLNALAGCGIGDELGQALLPGLLLLRARRSTSSASLRYPGGWAWKNAHAALSRRKRLRVRLVELRRPVLVGVDRRSSSSRAPRRRRGPPASSASARSAP